MITTLTEPEFDLVWERLGLGERPYPLDVPSFGETLDERAELLAQVLDSLAAKGCYDGRDLDRRFEDQLLLLARHEVSVDGLLAVGENLRVLGAARGGRGVLAVQSGGEIRVGPVPSERVVAEIIALVPDAEPGPGGPLSLPKAVFHEAVDAFARNGFAGLELALNQGGVRGRDMRTVATLVSSSRHGGGQLAANSLDRVGRRSRTDVLNWFDTEAGRYLSYPERQDRLTFTPADSARLAQRLRELVTSVTA
ncbi:ESX secretion-associated protein EspG [Actinokineospora sp.]|uniref:ESX secretion-associated protein EspG n=1 Tax=Actinokineospora sp. TaxID=1872133 RepID=UPI0040376E2E